MSLTGFLSHSLIKQSYLQGVEKNLKDSGLIIRDYYLAKENIQDQSLKKTLTQMSQDLKMRITLIDGSGNVLFDTEADAEAMSNHSEREEVQKALKGELGVAKRYSQTKSIDLFYMAIPINESGQIAKVIRLAVPLKEIEQYNKQLIYNILIAVAIGIFFSMIVGYRLLSSILLPIKDLKQIASRVAQGQYSEKVLITNNDELGDLARTFNYMTEELTKNMKEINAQNSKMSAMLTSLVNVVIAVDRDMKVMFMNREAENLFGICEAEAQGHYVLEVFRNSALLDQAKDLLKAREHIKTEIEIFDRTQRTYHVYANPILDFTSSPQNIGVVMVFQDVTDIRRLENMRKDFVANVSHELKTPLTSIKGFVETLKNGAVDNPVVRDRFLDIIEVEALRLTHLINDLLVLSDIEKRNDSGLNEEIALEQLTEEVVIMLSEAANKKQITLDYLESETLPKLYGNPNWVKQMMINIIDNAIKYTQPEGLIQVRLRQNAQKIEISVKDNGIGIAPEHIERLFERFYRVDKARSRNEGGTGLGLAIVKHIVLSFNGEIEVYSELNKGTEFVIKIPFSEQSILIR
jgi:two-component system phosphate regulon sensor histidine kinase PhoR